MTLGFFFLPAAREDLFVFLIFGEAAGAGEPAVHSSGSFRRPWKWSPPSERGRCLFMNVTAKLSLSTKSNQSKFCHFLYVVFPLRKRVAVTQVSILRQGRMEVYMFLEHTRLAPIPMVNLTSDCRTYERTPTSTAMLYCRGDASNPGHPRIFPSRDVRQTT